MTLIVGWIACDQRKPCSAYIVSDSRISNSVNHFDYSQKVFAFKNTPDIIGYCGEVLFTSEAISRLVSISDEGRLLQNEMDCEERSKILFDELRTSHGEYKLNDEKINIYHIGRNSEGKFQTFLYRWNKNTGWLMDEIDTNTKKSKLVFCDGSGAEEYRKRYMQFKKGNNEETSRNYFHCFCDILSNINDPYCGGAPQLVGLYNGNKFNGMYHGVIINDQRYYRAGKVNLSIGLDRVRWYNDKFEICNFDTMKIEKNAMRQPISKKATP